MHAQKTGNHDITDWFDRSCRDGTGVLIDIFSKSGCAVAVSLMHRLILQNFALNVAEKGFDIAVFNRSYEKTEACVKRAEKEGRHQ